MIPYTQEPPFFAQWGEDRWIAEHCDLPAVGVFVGVGAGDGVRGSNTLYFEGLGWHGLCIDADPRNRDLLARNRRCTIDTRAVARESGTQNFGMCKTKSSWSGLGQQGSQFTRIQVAGAPLRVILAEAGITRIDLLSIDVEGTELDVWRSLDTDLQRPQIAIIEYDNDHPGRTASVITDELGNAYEPVYQTPANLIFRRVMP